MRRLLGILLLLASCEPYAYADTPPQVINKLCPSNQFFSQIQPGPGNIQCTQPTYSGILDTPTFIDSLNLIAGNVSLVNDQSSPGSYKFYGTNSSGTRGWYPINTGITAVGTLDGVSPSSNGAVVSGTAIYMQSASSSKPGLVNNSSQTFSGDKTFTGNVLAFNLSGTNTGDVTIGTAHGLSLSGQDLSLGLSSSSTTGALSSTDWSTFNSKQSAGNYITALSGDVVATGPGSASSTIQSNVVSNSKLAQMSASTIKGNNTAGTANASDLTVSQVNTLLGDVTTLASVGSSPNSNGGSISGNTLTLQPANGSNPGVLTSGSQVIGGNKQALGTWNFTAATPDTGAIISIDNDQNQSLLSGTSQSGVTVWMAGNQNATHAIYGFNAAPIAADSPTPYTVNRMAGFVSHAMSAGTNATVTSGIAFFGVLPTVGSQGNAVLSDSADVEMPSAFVYQQATTAPSSFKGNVGIGSSNTSNIDGGSMLAVDNTQTQSLLGGSTQRGITSWLAGNSSATTEVNGFHTAPGTQAGSFTTGFVKGYSVGSFVQGSGSTITHAVNFYGIPQTVGTNNAFMADSSFTGNYSLYLAGTNPSYFNHNVNITGTVGASNLSGTNTGDVTIGTANGLSLSGQVLSLAAASTSTTGALTSTDWNTFNGKQASGNYITALTGDVAASGPGSASASIQSGVITNAMVNASAAIAFSKLASLTSAHILVGNGSNVATDVAMSSEGSLSNTGAFTLGSTLSGNKIATGRWGFTASSADTGSIISVDNDQSQSVITGTSQRGYTSWIRGTSNATVQISGFHSAPASAASSFTNALMTGYSIGNFTKGSSSTITRAVNFYGATQTVGSNNAWGSDSSGFSGNYFLYESGSNPSVLTGGINGTTDGSSAAAGTIGEYPTPNKVTTPTSVGTSATWFNMCSISLTAGDWQIIGVVDIVPNGATITQANDQLMALSQNSGTTTTDQQIGDNETSMGNVAGTAPHRGGTLEWDVNTNSSTTIYLKAILSYTVATPQYTCRISARRMH